MEVSLAISFLYFNPRTHVGCDTSYRSIHEIRVYFNPRTHVGCD